MIIDCLSVSGHVPGRPEQRLLQVEDIAEAAMLPFKMTKNALPLEIVLQVSPLPIADVATIIAAIGHDASADTLVNCRRAKTIRNRRHSFVAGRPNLQQMKPGQAMHWRLC